MTRVRANTLCLAVLSCSLLLLAWHAVPVGASATERDPDQPARERQEASLDDAAQNEANLDDEAWDEAPLDRGRSFLYKEAVVSSSFSQRQSNSVVLSDRAPGSYVALEYVRTFTSASRANRSLPGWLQLSAIDLHPRLVYYGEMPDPDSMRMSDDVDWPMPAGDAFDFAPQDFWVRFKLAGNDRLTLRIGQIALPFGVNPLLAPRQTFILPAEEFDLGLKWDWGVGIKGPLGEHDWELAATVGSGEAWHSPSSLGGERPSSHLFTGRLGSPAYWNFQYGLSALVGKLPTLHGPYMVDDFALSRRRLSLNGSYKLDTYLSIGAQVTYGQDGYAGDEEQVLINRGSATADVLGYRAWADWVPSVDNNLRVVGQFQSLTRDLETPDTTESALVFEISYSLTTEVTFKIDYLHALKDFMEMNEDALHLTFVYYGS